MYIEEATRAVKGPRSEHVRSSSIRDLLLRTAFSISLVNPASSSEERIFAYAAYTRHCRGLLPAHGAIVCSSERMPTGQRCGWSEQLWVRERNSRRCVRTERRAGTVRAFFRFGISLWAVSKTTTTRSSALESSEFQVPSAERHFDTQASHS